ncbi:MAG: cell wall-active antibiotics response protein [candidate division KSB1 bacterium]|nr:cell wall-active antibiotics response protein [candidate division KSB1 bacterium]
MKPYQPFVVFLIHLLLSLPNNTISESRSAEKVNENYKVRLDVPLSVEINMKAGQVAVQKNQLSDQVTISLRYNDRVDEIDVEYNERRNELLMVVDRRNWLHSIRDDDVPQLQLLLPTAAVIKLDATIKAGKIEFMLDSLKISKFELQSWAGEVKVDFPSPNRTQMETLDIDLKIGEARLRHLGNACFREAHINGGIGQLEIDFAGSGLSSASADIDLDIGETRIYLPADVGVRLDSSTFGFLTQSRLDFKFDKKGRFYLSENYQSAGRKMDLSIRAGIGDLTVMYR